MPGSKYARRLLCHSECGPARSTTKFACLCFYRQQDSTIIWTGSPVASDLGPLRKVVAVMTKVAQRTVTETRVFAGRPIFGAAGLVHYKSSTKNVGANSIGSTGWRTLCDCIAIRDCEKGLLRFSCSKPQLRARAAESLPSSARQIFPLASYLQSLQDRPSLNGTHVDVDTHLLTKLGSWRLRMTDP
jgi:hypothetical protein